MGSMSRLEKIGLGAALILSVIAVLAFAITVGQIIEAGTQLIKIGCPASG